MPPGGYAWWYVDAISDDRRFGLTLIAFIGSVFSPYYFWRNRRAPTEHVAMNVALYGPGRHRWAMTERRAEALRQAESTLSIGPSALDWDGDALAIHVDEVTAPLPSRIRGVVRLRPAATVSETFPLDPEALHRWRPIVPRARIEVRLTAPALSWEGEGYLDSNAGVEPLEAGFSRWHWSRAHLSRDTAILYDGVRRDGSDFALALRIGADGSVRRAEPPPIAVLPRTLWRLDRVTRADPIAAPTITRRWEDTPFYARSALSTRLYGEDADAVHESLDLDRFRLPVVKAMLPFRMPRRFG